MCMCRLRWTAGNAQMLCYLRPFANPHLTFLAKVAYTLANWSWIIGILIWALLSYVMIGWIIFQVTTRQLFNAFYAYMGIHNFSLQHDVITQVAAAPAVVHGRIKANVAWHLHV